MTGEATPAEWERVIECTDSFGRERTLRVSVTEDGKVSILPPPGASFQLSPAGVAQLRRALAAALDQAAPDALRDREMG